MSNTSNSSSEQNQAVPPVGVIGMFDNVDSLLSASRKMRDAGYTKWEAHSSFPVHGMDKAAGIKPTILPWIVLVGGICGASGGLLMQYWMNAVDYQYIISGKPFFSLPANIPVIFEMTILFSAFGAFFGMHILNGFPRWSNALFRVPEFKDVTGDRFAIVVDAKDPKFEVKGAFLNEIGASKVVVVPADPTSLKLPMALHGAGLLLTLLAVIPITLILRARYTTSDQPRIHVVPDMDFQWFNKGQTASGNYADERGIFPHLKLPRFTEGEIFNVDHTSGKPIFADGRAMRKDVEGTVAVGSMADDALRVFKTGDVYRNDLPIALTADLLDLGQTKFQVYCAPCHGSVGKGDGPVHLRAASLEEGTWVQPTDLHSETTRAMATGQIYEALTDGIRNMPAYKAMLSPEDRWAVVAYVRALQASSDATTQK
ncbi:MAG: DUF3341 domain-containing protein [Planctomycetes bacterium]|nr:DUF3341 domain-containing protein [Planctomycetota bacterium]